MSAGSFKPKIIHFSHALYSKGTQEELNMHETGSITADHKILIALTNYYQSSIDRQRELLAQDEKGIVEAHIQAIIKLDNSKPVLAYALPSLDGILFGTRP